MLLFLTYKTYKKMEMGKKQKVDNEDCAHTGDRLNY